MAGATGSDFSFFWSGALEGPDGPYGEQTKWIKAYYNNASGGEGVA